MMRCYLVVLAALGAGCSVGPYAVIEDGAVLGADNEIGSGIDSVSNNQTRHILFFIDVI